jgi:2-dehydropantoate 2-reductase
VLADKETVLMAGQKIAVVGCGAIGSTFLTALARAGHDVIGIDPWPEHVYRVRDAGYTVEGVEESFEVRPRMFFPDGIDWQDRFDLVVLATKGYENRWSALLARDLLAPDGVLISAQNGLHERYLPGVIGGDRVVGCVVAMGAELTGPGALRFTTGRERTHLLFGELDGRASGRPEALGALWESTGPVVITPDIWSELWCKYALNVMSNGLAGVSGYRVGQLWTDDETTRIFVALGHEVAEVASALGQTVHPVLTTIPLELLRAATASDTPEWQEAVRLLKIEGAKRVGMRDNVSSLLQDLRRGRRTEVDHLNGLICQLGRSAGVETPLNELMVTTLHAIEEGKAETGRDALAQVSRGVDARHGGNH